MKLMQVLVSLYGLDFWKVPIKRSQAHIVSPRKTCWKT